MQCELKKEESPEKWKFERMETKNANKMTDEKKNPSKLSS